MSVPVRTPADADAAYAAAQRVVDVHRRLSEWLRPGTTLVKVDNFVAESLADMGAKSCFLGYRAGRLPPFPSHACLSVNECIVHGTAVSLERPLEEGDVLKVDIGVSYHGWIGDAAWTYVFGEPVEDVRRLMKAGKESLSQGIASLRGGEPYMNWATTVQGIVEDRDGLHLARGLGGHGYGRKLHAPPFISNTRPTFPGEWPDGSAKAKPGTLLALEPMIAVGTGQTKQAPKQWPIYTADGSLSVHYEHDILITEGEPRLLTEGLDELPDIIR